MTDPAPTSEARQLLQQRDYMLFLAARFCASIGVQIQAVNIGWQVYALAREGRSVKEAAFILSMIGLVQFLPVLFLTLPAGQIVDSHNRRNIMRWSLWADIASTAVLGLLSHFNPMLWPIFVVAAMFGASRAFLMPAGGAMVPRLVPRPLLPRALAWSSLGWQTASVFGPVLGGLIIALPVILGKNLHWPQTETELQGVGVTLGYTTSGVLYIASITFLSLIRANLAPEPNPGSRWEMVKEGLHYVWNQKIVFGAISLDLFAVLLGGATVLMPVFAADVLHVGATGFGILRASPGIGAALVAAYLSVRPVKRRAGSVMFTGVAIFGVATIIFGVAQPIANYLGQPLIALPLSVIALAVLGGADMVSVYVRQTLIQIVTPDHMRGRVAATSSLFIGASNELGEFESGIVARFLGPIGAAVFGGVGSLVVTGLWTQLFPALRKADSLINDEPGTA